MHGLVKLRSCIGSPHDRSITLGSHTWDEASIETHGCYNGSVGLKLLLPLLKERFQEARLEGMCFVLSNDGIAFL